MGKTVTVVAHIRAKEGKEESVRHELLALIAPTRAEQGCIQYDLHRSLENRCLFMFYENWTSKEALDEHLNMPYIQNFMEKAEALLQGPVEITLWEMIGEQ